MKFKIFPSKNEALITTVIFAFVIGCGIGIIAGMQSEDSSTIINAMTTLFAAFFGAWFAYKLQDNSKKREEKARQIAAINQFMFAMFQKINALKLYQIDTVNPHRDNPAKLLSMEAVLDFKLPETQINIETINFLLETKHRQIIFDAHIEEERLLAAERIIQFRSQLHYRQVQPILSQSGMREGQQYTDIEFRQAIGEMLYRHLERATNDVIYHVDRTVKSVLDFKENFIKVIKELYPNVTFTNFEILDQPFNQALKAQPSAAGDAASGAP